MADPEVEEEEQEVSEIFEACRDGDLDTLKNLITSANVNELTYGEEENSDDENDPYYYNASPLYWAAMYGYIEVVEYLISMGSDLTLVEDNEQKRNALLVAAGNGYTDVITSLLEAGASINAADTYKWTSLHQAAAEGQVEAVETLIEAGIDIEFKNEEGWTALHLACWNGSPDVVQALLTGKANVNTKTPKGENALDIAARRQDHSIIGTISAFLKDPLATTKSTNTHSAQLLAQRITNFFANRLGKAMNEFGVSTEQLTPKTPEENAALDAKVLNLDFLLKEQNKNVMDFIKAQESPDLFVNNMVGHFLLEKVADWLLKLNDKSSELISMVDVKSYMGAYEKLFVRGKRLNDLVRARIITENASVFFDAFLEFIKESGEFDYWFEDTQNQKSVWKAVKIYVYAKDRDYKGKILPVEIQVINPRIMFFSEKAGGHEEYEIQRLSNFEQCKKIYEKNSKTFNDTIMELKDHGIDLTHGYEMFKESGNFKVEEPPKEEKPKDAMETEGEEEEEPEKILVAKLDPKDSTLEFQTLQFGDWGDDDEEGEGEGEEEEEGEEGEEEGEGEEGEEGEGEEGEGEGEGEEGEGEEEEGEEEGEEEEEDAKAGYEVICGSLFIKSKMEMWTKEKFNNSEKDLEIFTRVKLGNHPEEVQMAIYGHLHLILVIQRHSVLLTRSGTRLFKKAGLSLSTTELIPVRIKVVGLDIHFDVDNGHVTYTTSLKKWDPLQIGLRCDQVSQHFTMLKDFNVRAGRMGLFFPENDGKTFNALWTGEKEEKLSEMSMAFIKDAASTIKDGILYVLPSSTVKSDYFHPAKDSKLTLNLELPKAGKGIEFAIADFDGGNASIEVPKRWSLSASHVGGAVQVGVTLGGKSIANTSVPAQESGSVDLIIFFHNGKIYSHVNGTLVDKSADYVLGREVRAEISNQNDKEQLSVRTLRLLPLQKGTQGNFFCTRSGGYECDECGGKCGAKSCNCTECRLLDQVVGQKEWVHPE